MRHIYISIITLVVAIFSSFAAFAQRSGETEAQKNESGIVYDKYLTVKDADNREYIITLETYVTGFPKSVGSDIVLVLDLSSSMDDELSSSGGGQGGDKRDGKGGGQSGTKTTRLDALKDALEEFIGIVQTKSSKLSGNHHNLAVVGFNKTASVIQSLDDAKNVSSDNVISKLKTSQGTVPM